MNHERLLELHGYVSHIRPAFGIMGRNQEAALAIIDAALAALDAHRQAGDDEIVAAMCQIQAICEGYKEGGTSSGEAIYGIELAVRAALAVARQMDGGARDAALARGATADRVFFYEREFYVLSNFSAFRLTWRGHDFDTSEHAYHWAKFDCEGGESVQFLILTARSAHEAYRVAQDYRHLSHVDWDSVKVSVMREILNEKAHQHEYVRRKLLETGDRELIEDSWRDDFWGWGEHGDGQNMLGKLWMEARAAMRGVVGDE